MDISIEPWKKLVIHEVIEYQFEDWVKQIAFSTRTSGGGIPTMQWANGIVFSPANFSLIANEIDDQCKIPFNCSSIMIFVLGKFEGENTIPFAHCIVGMPPPDVLVLKAICFTQSSN